MENLRFIVHNELKVLALILDVFNLRRKSVGEGRIESAPFSSRRGQLEMVPVKSVLTWTDRLQVTHLQDNFAGTAIMKEKIAARTFMDHADALQICAVILKTTVTGT